MQTSFSLAQLADPDIAEANKILRACVHCGFCTATCPTYVLLGDELDSPRGRIYLIKDMLENERAATADVVKHIDRCLSCLACMTTCPSGVHYMHLVDHARAHIEATYRRPLPDRLMRAFLAAMLPYPRRFRAGLALTWLAGQMLWIGSQIPWKFRQPVMIARQWGPRVSAWLGIAKRTRAMLRLSPRRLPDRSALEGPGLFPAQGERKARVALLQGCAQQVLAPQIDEAAIRVLNRHGVEVVRVRGERCCGALVHHMGRAAAALASARNNVDVWVREIEGEGLDAILTTTSGCGTTMKDYGFMLRADPAYADKAARVAGLVRDISEYLATLEIAAPVQRSDLVVAYHAACSLQHGQKITRQPKQLLEKCGFTLRDVAEGHLCCGSAGTYNMLQADLAAALRDRKVANIEKTGADVVATSNIGCIAQIGSASTLPVVHTVELIDWAGGGPSPPALGDVAMRRRAGEGALAP
jgi:glycolate dehydrogenase iron-sulfur subunit